MECDLSQRTDDKGSKEECPAAGQTFQKMSMFLGIDLLWNVR
jgi:hypothetical protein